MLIESEEGIKSEKFVVMFYFIQLFVKYVYLEEGTSIVSYMKQLVNKQNCVFWELFEIGILDELVFVTCEQFSGWFIVRNIVVRRARK